MEQYFPVLNKCALFRGVDESKYKHLIGCLDAQIKDYSEDEYVFFAGEEIKHVGIIFSGKIQILKENAGGKQAYNSDTRPLICSQRESYV